MWKLLLILLSFSSVFIFSNGVDLHKSTPEELIAVPEPSTVLRPPAARISRRTGEEQRSRSSSWGLGNIFGRLKSFFSPKKPEEHREKPPRRTILTNVKNAYKGGKIRNTDTFLTTLFGGHPEHEKKDGPRYHYYRAVPLQPSYGSPHQTHYTHYHKEPYHHKRHYYSSGIIIPPDIAAGVTLDLLKAFDEDDYKKDDGKKHHHYYHYVDDYGHSKGHSYGYSKGGHHGASYGYSQGGHYGGHRKTGEVNPQTEYAQDQTHRSSHHQPVYSAPYAQPVYSAPYQQPVYSVPYASYDHDKDEHYKKKKKEIRIPPEVLFALLKESHKDGGIRIPGRLINSLIGGGGLNLLGGGGGGGGGSGRRRRPGRRRRRRRKMRRRPSAPATSGQVVRDDVPDASSLPLEGEPSSGGFNGDSNNVDTSAPTVFAAGGSSGSDELSNDLRNALQDAGVSQESIEAADRGEFPREIIEAGLEDKIPRELIYRFTEEQGIDVERELLDAALDGEIDRELIFAFVDSLNSAESRRVLTVIMKNMMARKHQHEHHT